MSVVTRGNNGKSLSRQVQDLNSDAPPRAASSSEVGSSGNGWSVLASLAIGKAMWVGVSAKHGWRKMFQGKKTLFERVEG